MVLDIFAFTPVYIEPSNIIYIQLTHRNLVSYSEYHNFDFIFLFPCYFILL